MTRISSTDSVLLLLREQLARNARTKARVGDAAPRQAGARERIAALAAARALPDDELERAAVRGLLGERLGAAIAAEPGFELVVREVARMIAEAPEGAELLAAARQQVLGG